MCVHVSVCRYWFFQGAVCETFMITGIDLTLGHERKSILSDPSLHSSYLSETCSSLEFFPQDHRCSLVTSIFPSLIFLLLTFVSIIHAAARVIIIKHKACHVIFLIKSFKGFSPHQEQAHKYLPRPPKLPNHDLFTLSFL